MKIFMYFFCISSFLSLIIIIISNIWWQIEMMLEGVAAKYNNHNDEWWWWWWWYCCCCCWLVDWKVFFWLLEKKIIQWLGLLHVGITIIHPSSLLLIKQHEYTYTHRERDCYIRSKQIGQKSNKNNNEVDIFTLDQFFLVIIHCE